MSTGDSIISQPWRVLRLDSIRNKILVFAVLATLIPTLATTYFSYAQNKRSLSEKITGELRSVSGETAREMDVWLQERLYDLRVFASSYVVSENLASLNRGRTGGQALGRLNDYLTSVRERFTDYEELLVVDADGRVVTSRASRTSVVSLPPDGLRDLRRNEPFVGDASWDPALKKAVLILAVPVHQAGGRFLGAFAAKLNLHSVAAILERLSPGGPGGPGAVYLMTNTGSIVIRSHPGSAAPKQTALPEPTTRALFKEEGATVEYRGADGDAVIGTLRRVPALRWAAVAETPREEAFRQVTRLRNVTALILAALLAGVGLIAYVLGLVIVRPLGRLTTAAGKVAAGDLAVDVPVPAHGGGEVGYLTAVFNNMVARLRESREKLEQLSVTDSLTGLYNRRHLMETLAKELARSRRLRHPCSVLMADVDHFKRYNDDYGHLAGDAALERVAEILREATRGVDCPARYGGEEFLVMLPETGLARAAEVAERIRARVAAETFGDGKITVSIGVAEFPRHGETPEALIAAADAALYQAKDTDRNRVVAARGTGPKETTPKPA